MGLVILAGSIASILGLIAAPWLMARFGARLGMAGVLVIVSVGLVFVGCADIVTGDPAAPAIPMALAGMAAFFAATVRAPLTGIVIVLEMTAATSMALPMIVATAGAVLAARAVRAEPVYAGLRQRMTVEAPGADERR